MVGRAASVESDTLDHCTDHADHADHTDQFHGSRSLVQLLGADLQGANDRDMFPWQLSIVQGRGHDVMCVPGFASTLYANLIRSV